MKVKTKYKTIDLDLRNNSMITVHTKNKEFAKECILKGLTGLFKKDDELHHSCIITDFSGSDVTDLKLKELYNILKDRIEACQEKKFSNYEMFSRYNQLIETHYFLASEYDAYTNEQKALVERVVRLARQHNVRVVALTSSDDVVAHLSKFSSIVDFDIIEEIV